MSLSTYLINLDRDCHRLDRMRAQLDTLGLTFERVCAVNGAALPDDLKPYFLKPDGNLVCNMKPGEIGCYASHLKVLQRVAASDLPALILEDDLMIASDFPSILESLDRLPAGWDIVRLSNGSNRLRFHIGALTPGYDVVKYSRVPASTGAYLINPQGARKFLAWKTTRVLPIDQDLRRTWDCGLVTYGISPMPIMPSLGASSITAMGPAPVQRRSTRGNGVVDTVIRVRHDIEWLGFANWARSLMPGRHVMPAAQGVAQLPAAAD